MPIEISIINEDIFESEFAYLLHCIDNNPNHLILTGGSIKVGYDTVDTSLRDNISIIRINVKDRSKRFSNYLIDINGNSYHCLLSLLESELNVHFMNTKAMYHKKAHKVNESFCVEGFIIETNYKSVKTITEEEYKIILENKYIFYNKEYYLKYHEEKYSDLYEFQGFNDVTCHIRDLNGEDYIIFIEFSLFEQLQLDDLKGKILNFYGSLYNDLELDIKLLQVDKIIVL